MESERHPGMMRAGRIRGLAFTAVCLAAIVSTTAVVASIVQSLPGWAKYDQQPYKTCSSGQTPVSPVDLPASSILPFLIVVSSGSVESPSPLGRLLYPDAATVRLARASLLNSKEWNGVRVRGLKWQASWLVRSYYLAWTLDNDQVVERLLNRSYMSRGVYGVGCAAQRFLGKKWDSLSVSEAAQLAATWRFGSWADPCREESSAKASRDRIIFTLHDAAAITMEEAQRAAMEPLNLQSWCDQQ